MVYLHNFINNAYMLNKRLTVYISFSQILTVVSVTAFQFNISKLQLDTLAVLT